MNTRLWLIIGFFVVLAPMSAAEPFLWAIEDGGNGHYYEPLGFIYPDGGDNEFDGVSLSWDEARLIAESREFNGMSGHLVTVTTEAEMALLGGFFLWTNSYVGAWKLETWNPDPEVEGGWRWITGETWDPEVMPNSPWPIEDEAGGAMSISCGPYSHSILCGFHPTDPYTPVDGAIGFIVEYDGLPLTDVPPDGIVSSESTTWGALKSLYR